MSLYLEEFMIYLIIKDLNNECFMPHVKNS